jgi:hypothetical protein
MAHDKTIQYRQIDFLRLFRLCRDQGIVRRKRKMPIQYDRASHINSSCSKLFKSFLTGTFEDATVEPNNRYGTYGITISNGSAERLTWLMPRTNSLRDGGNPEHSLIVEKWTEILEVANNHFINNLRVSGQEARFTINVKPRESRYSRLYGTISANGHHITISRPQEEYYRAAKACLAFKDVWNSNIGLICSFVDRERDNVERAERAAQEQAEQNRRRAQEEAERNRRRAQEEANELRQQRDAENRRIQQEREDQQAQVRAQAERERSESRRRAQQMFNEALAARRGQQNV